LSAGHHRFISRIQLGITDSGTTIRNGPAIRGLHSFTSQLNLSAFYGIGGARMGCVARVKGVLGGVYGV
jgi:hypothetical protein